MKLDRDLKNVMLKISDFFEERDIPFVIVGALVLAVLIDMKKKNQTSYGSLVTRDVDCVIKINSWDEYKRLKKDMLENGFEEKKHAPEHRLFFNETPVDIIPFGRKMVKNDMLIWPKSDFKMNVRGFDKLFEMKEYVPIEKGHTVAFTPLPLVVFLKIQSYYDRKETKDLEDLFYILIHYEEIEISEKRFDVSAEKNLDYDTAGAYLLGCDLRNLLSADDQKNMKPFFDIFLDPESTYVLESARLTSQKTDEIINLVTAFKRGLRND
ncbi:hypothetical protein JW824_14045 [bacterium]|nr:hypothetical protein [bacterium]